MITDKCRKGHVRWYVTKSPLITGPPPTKCPICGGDLSVNVEYLLDVFGPAYEYLPWSQWIFYCNDCEEAGTWPEIEKIARGK